MAAAQHIGLDQRSDPNKEMSMVAQLKNHDPSADAKSSADSGNPGKRGRTGPTEMETIDKDFKKLFGYQQQSQQQQQQQ